MFVIIVKKSIMYNSLIFQIQMRYVAAYLLAVLGGNENPTAKDIKVILNSVGVDAEEDRLALVIKQLHGKDVEEVIANGQYQHTPGGAFTKE